MDAGISTPDLIAPTHYTDALYRRTISILLVYCAPMDKSFNMEIQIGTLDDSPSKYIIRR